MRPIHRVLFSCYLLFTTRLSVADKNCFQDSTDIHYLFVNDLSAIRVPLVPLNCPSCQSAYQVDIQLIDEQATGNRTIQRLKIFLKNFEIEDSSYICLRNLCPILVEHGSDSIVLNIVSSFFSHVFLSFNYFHNSEPSKICSLETRFAIYSFEQSLICAKQVFLHPRLNIPIRAQLSLYDCRADSFEQTIYQRTVQFHRQHFSITNHQTTSMKASDKPCEYILESTVYLENSTSIVQTKGELLTTVGIYPWSNPWNKTVQLLGPCRTNLIPYQEMFFTADVVHIRDVHVEQGQTIQIDCPIDGSIEYVKYVWYYQRHQPKYQISTHRTMLLKNTTGQMQGKYICIADDQNEKLEFEMTLHVFNSTTKTFNSWHTIIVLILVTTLLVFCLILTLIIYFPLRKCSRMTPSSEKSPSLTIHHDVLLTIQPPPTDSLWNQPPYQTLDYIDEQPVYPPSSWSWRKPSNSDLIPYRFSTRHRNINGQLPASVPSHSDMTFKAQSIVDSFNERQDQMEIIKISVPSFNQYPVVQSTSSVISFDSENELSEFTQMTFVCSNDD